VHHWRNEMGVPARCKRAMGHKSHVVWLPMWPFLHRRGKPTPIVCVATYTTFCPARAVHTLFGCTYEGVVVTSYLRVVKLSSTVNWITTHSARFSSSKVAGNTQQVLTILLVIHDKYYTS
jgi:hypothetical protein